jgi:hypothetical protein
MKPVNKIIKRMGTTWCLHPSNHVQRLPTPKPDSVGTDLAATFARVRSEKAVPDNVRKIVVAK